MSRPVLTDYTKRLILDGRPEYVPPTSWPIEGEKGSERLRFNAIVIRPRDTGPGVQVVYRFDAREVAVMIVEDYAPGMELHLLGLEAHMALHSA